MHPLPITDAARIWLLPRESEGDGDEAGRASETKTGSDRTQEQGRRSGAAEAAWIWADGINGPIAAAVP